MDIQPRRPSREKGIDRVRKVSPSFEVTEKKSLQWRPLFHKHAKKISFAGLAVLLGTAFLSLYFHLRQPETLSLTPYAKAGESALTDLQALPSTPLEEDKNTYFIEDTLSEGIEISYPNQPAPEQKPKTKIILPKDYAHPIEINLDDQKRLTIKDNDNQGYTTTSLNSETFKASNSALFRKIFPEKTKKTNTYLRYQKDRKSLLYSYQRDRASGERKLKHWTFYEEGTGEESESYTIEGAKLQKNDQGDILIFFQSEQDLKNDAAAKDVDPSLMERAMRTLEKDGVNNPKESGQNPDLVIPKPYFYDKDGNYNEGEWEVNQDTITLHIKTNKESYPIAVDPTLSFTAPGVSNGGGNILGETSNNFFGSALASADVNADGKMDLIIGALGYSTNTGRTYIFYGKGSSASTAANSADVIITGETSSAFGIAVATGDFNADGRIDLVVDASDYTTATGRVYIFYNDGSIPTTAATADVIITGEATNNNFGTSLAGGDLNADGKVDLVVGAYGYSTNTGRTYIFYNDGSIPTTAATADVIITGEATNNYFGKALATGDFNADSKADVSVGAYGYSSSFGRTYIFYNDGSIPTTAATADVFITGASLLSFGDKVTAGDLNADGRTDLAIAATAAGGSAGKVYIFYNDGSIPTTAATADVTISGGVASNELLGTSLVTGDFNGDGKIDLVAGAYGHTTNTGRAYIFYNDGSIPTTSDTADVIITGETTSNNFGYSLASGDLNADGRVDLAIGAYGYSSSKGKAYIFYSQNGVLNTNQSISGEASSGLGGGIVSGDFNADGRVDIAVSAYGYSSGAGRVYIFYNDGSIPTTAATADVIITGEASSSFGWSLSAGDLNADGKTDVAVGAYAYSSTTGRAYIFYNDGSIPTTAATADVIITGEASSNFGMSMVTGDFNADRKVDLAVGADAYSTQTGRAYTFYNDGSIPTTAATADVIITGETASDLFGISLVSGDFDTDGKTDLIVGAPGYSLSAGRIYLFYNGFSTNTADFADVIIDGAASSGFGQKLAAGDLNADGKTDVIASTYIYSSNTGRVYIFYQTAFFNPGSVSGADVTMTGSGTSNSFGYSLITSDFNLDGKVDLAVSAYQYSTTTGRVYIFYNDGSYPTTAATADVTLTGPATSSNFGLSIGTGDINADGRQDLIVGASGVSSSAGQAYIYEGRDNYSWTLQNQAVGTSRISVAGVGEELAITGSATTDYFGISITTGDLNTDGKMDLVVSSENNVSSIGRVYVFYNDGSYSPRADGADVVIGDTTSQRFGHKVATGDLNADGKTDLVVGAYAYSTSTGHVYIFYNDGVYPSLAANADVILTGETSSNYFGNSFSVGDLNADGKVDLVVGAYGYSSNAGRAYIFYADGTSNFGTATCSGTPAACSAANADVIITGEAATYFSVDSLATGDINADGKTDLIVGAPSYSSNAGRSYIFYNDGSIPTTAATADVIINGQTSSYFGRALAVGDLNADGKRDLVISASDYPGSGRAYIFYNDGSIPTTAATADVIIDGQNGGFGSGLTIGDFNADGKEDLVVGAYGYSGNTGRVYVLYNDGSYPALASNADVLIDGESSSSSFGLGFVMSDFNVDGKQDLVVTAQGYNSYRGRVYMYTLNDSVTSGGTTNDQFGSSLTVGDFNADGKTDLAVGAQGYSGGGGTGRAYVFYGGSALDTSPSSADVTITGETTSTSFGSTLVSGDLNADGKVDLVVAATGYSTNTGRVYIFYNGAIITENASGADVIITGETTGSYFGVSLATSDLNADGKTDLVTGAYGYSSFTGRAYIFYNDGSIPTTAATADVIITGSAGSNFGYVLASGDLNTDGKVDLIVGSTNKAVIFYNDGTYPTIITSADVIIDAGGGNNFGLGLGVGDFNADGRTDVVVSDNGYSSYTGRAYIFYNDGSIPTTPATADVTITGENTSDRFGTNFIAGDFNYDGKADLLVTAYGYSTYTGRAYIFYNDGSISTTAATADKFVTNSTTNSYFGWSIVAGDFNMDSIIDLAVGAYGYSTNTGRVYTFITEVGPTSTEDRAAQVTGNAKLTGPMELR